MARLFPLVMWHLEEPRVGISYQIYAVSQLVRDHVTVVLSGVGGDELFAGYPWRYACIEGLTDSEAFDRAYYKECSRLLDDETRASVFSGSFNRELGGFSPFESFRTTMRTCGESDPLHRALYFDSKGFLQGLLLVEDKLSMAHSIETRVPFLDNEVIDYALTVPASLKLFKDQSKIVLRRALRDLLPARHIERRKQGFTPPDASWYRTKSLPYIREMLMSERFLDRGVFARAGIEKVLAEHREGRSNHRFLLWSLMAFEWMNRLFLDSEPMQSPRPAVSVKPA